MKRLGLVCAVVLLAAVGTVRAGSIGSFIADSDQFGYSGTVTGQSSGTVAVPSGMDASVYFTNNPTSASLPLGGSYSGTYNDMESNWYQSPGSNQSAGFFQINDGGSVTSASAVWTQEAGGLWDFSLTVVGQNATYDNSSARLWGPDTGVASGGTFTSYSYTLTATGMNTQETAGWLYNTDNPTGITGSFQGDFVSDGSGATYAADLAFDMNLFNSEGWNTQYPEYGYGAAFSQFAAPDSGITPLAGGPVPEPITMAGVLLGIGALGRYWSRKRRVA